MVNSTPTDAFKAFSFPHFHVACADPPDTLPPPVPPPLPPPGAFPDPNQDNFLVLSSAHLFAGRDTPTTSNHPRALHTFVCASACLMAQGFEYLPVLRHEHVRILAQL
jgi:hypothetical protein